MRILLLLVCVNYQMTAHCKTFEKANLGDRNFWTTELSNIYNGPLSQVPATSEYICITLIDTTDTTHLSKPVKIWIYNKNNEVVKGLLTRASDSSLSVELQKDHINQSVIIGYSTVNMIKIKKKGSLLKGILIGGGIGLLPVIFGQGGAYVAVVTFPAGLITGAIVGATSKKKYVIDGDITAFAEFVHKVSR